MFGPLGLSMIDWDGEVFRIAETLRMWFAQVDAMMPGSAGVLGGRGVVEVGGDGGGEEAGGKRKGKRREYVFSEVSEGLGGEVFSEGTASEG